MTRYAARVDANHAEIVASLRDVGAAVVDLSRVGHGCVDILVAFRGRWYVAELKTATGTLTPDEYAWHQEYGWYAPVHVWHSVDEALKCVGAI